MEWLIIRVEKKIIQFHPEPFNLFRPKELCNGAKFLITYIKLTLRIKFINAYIRFIWSLLLCMYICYENIFLA